MVEDPAKNTHEWSWVTAAVFIAFAHERKIKFACSACPGTFLQVNAGDEPGGYIPWVSAYSMSADLVDVTDSRHIPCVRTTCDNCGHINHYSMYEIQRWKAQKAVQKADDNG